MGADSKYQEYSSDLSYKEVQEEFRKLSREADSYSGHQEGYSGDWNTIHGPIKEYRSNESDGIFSNLSEARKCLESSVEKWDGGYARFYISSKEKENKLSKKISSQAQKLQYKIDELYSQLRVNIVGINEFKKESGEKFMTCPKCESKYKVKHQNFEYAEKGKRIEGMGVKYIKKLWIICAVCSNEIESVSGITSLINKAQKLSENIEELLEEKQKLEIEKQKVLTSKTDKIGTLIYGLAAC